MLASKKDIEKYKKELEVLKKKYSNNKVEEKEVVQMLRSAIRKVWMRSKFKRLLLLENREIDTDDTTRRRWKQKCVMCKQYHNESGVEIDHKQGEHQLKTIDGDLVDFVKNILLVYKCDLQILCKKCHNIKTYSERHGITLEESKIENTLRNIIKNNKKDIIIEELKNNNKQYNNEKIRKNGLRELIITNKLSKDLK